MKAEVNYASSGDRKRFLSGLISLEEEKSRLSNGILGKTEEQFDHGVLREGLHEDPMDDDQAGTPPPKAHKFSAPMGESSDVEDSAQEDENGQSHPAEQSGDSIVISEQQLRHHFHLPLHTAAQKFGICTTAFKKLCRRFGIAKWPHRQLRGIDKKIAALKAELNYATGDRELCRESLQALQEEKSRLSRSGSCGAISNATSALDSTPIVTPGTSPKAEEYISSSHSHTDEEDDEDIDVPAGATALDLLAAVAGVKERQDNEERERLSGLQSANSSPKLRDTLFDTPPMQPMPTMSMQPRIQMLVSPILKFNAASTGMDPFASSSLVGLAWTGAVS